MKIFVHKEPWIRLGIWIGWVLGWTSLASPLDRYNHYLEKIQSLKASLTQICPDGRKMSGRLYIKKPGKLRLIYEPAHTLELLSDGERLTQYDWRTKESDSISLEGSPLAFLLKKGRLQEGALVDRIIMGSKWTQILVRSKEDPEAGQVTLVFQEHPLRLIRWVILDPQGKKTVVSLSRIQINVPIPSQAFQWKKEGRSP